MARRITPVAEKHGEICAINRCIRIDISCRGVALCWSTDENPRLCAIPAVCTPKINLTSVVSGDLSPRRHHFNSTIRPATKDFAAC